MIKKTICALLAFIFLLGFPTVLADGHAGDITTLCDISIGDNVKIGNIYDEDIDTYCTVKESAPLTVFFGDNKCSGIYIEWTTLPEKFTFEQYSNSGVSISRTEYNEPMLCMFLQVDADAAKVVLSLEESKRLGKLAVYSLGELPSNVQTWDAPAEKADLMIFTAHPDDEHLFFGGVMPYYTGELGLKTQVVYMSHQKRLRQDEALAGLWTSGVRNYPVFLGFKDKYSNNYADAAAAWGEDTVLERIVTQLRRFKPEVVITHDVNGEYGHGTHCLAARALMVTVLTG